MKMLDKIFDRLLTSKMGAALCSPEDQELLLLSRKHEAPAESKPAPLREPLHHIDDSTQIINTREMARIAAARDLIEPAPVNDDAGKWWNYPGHPDAGKEPVILCDQATIDGITAHLNQKIIAGETPVFTVPSSIMEAMRLLEKSDFDYGEVARIIEKNPALTGLFLSSINSSFYNRGYAVTELRSALSRFGKNNIRALLQIYSIKITFANDELFGKVASDIISHSYIVAVIASYLSQRYYPEPGLAFLAGLLHDIGKLGVLKELSSQPRFTLRLKDKLNESMFDQIFAGRHEQVGLLLGKQWNMDRLTLAAIERHHNFWNYSFDEADQLDYHLCLLINLSDKMARILGFGRPLPPVNIFLEPAAPELNLEKNIGAIEFLDQLPEIVAYKAANNAI